MAQPVTRKLDDLGPMHALLLKACPACLKDENTGKYIRVDNDGFKSTAILADLIGMSTWGIHLWIKRGRIPAKRAKQIADLNPQEVSIDEFSPYIYS